MTESNNTPNDPSEQESLDDVLRGLSAEGSEEEQSLDDILASLSADEPEEETPTPEILETDDLLTSSINDSLEPDTSVEPAVPTPSPAEPEAFFPTLDVNTPTGAENISAEAEQWIDDATAESILSDTSAEPGEPTESAIPEVEEPVSFDIADSSFPTAETPSEVSPFEPPAISQRIGETESPFESPSSETPAENPPESTLANDAGSTADPFSSSVDEFSSPESQATDSTPEPSTESETLPEPTLPAMEEAASFGETNAGIEPPVFDSQPEAIEEQQPFSEPISDVVEPAFTSFVGADDPPEAPSPEQPIEEPTLESGFESADSVDEPQMTGQPWTQASEPDLPLVPEPRAFESEPSLTPLDTSAEPEPEPAPPAADFNQPEEAINEPAAREALELTDSDSDFSGPELPSLPPLAQPTFSEPAASLSQASIDTPAAVSPDPEAPPLTLQRLLDRPRHRWLLPFGFIMILVLFGAIIFGALRGNQESDPAPETQEQSSGLDHTHELS